MLYQWGAMQVHASEFAVRTFDCGKDGRLKLNVLMQYLQEAAAQHAERLGVGFVDLDRVGGFWVLVNLRMAIAAMPRWRDTVLVETWPSGWTRSTASREFVVRTPEGAGCVRAGSEWMILDRQSGRPRNLRRMELGLPSDAPKALDVEPHRLRVSDDYAQAHRLHVPFSSLDFNGHVNNTEYVRWAMDGLHEALGELPAIRSAQMTFLAEAFAGDEIEVAVGREDASLHVLERRARRRTDRPVPHGSWR